MPTFKFGKLTIPLTQVFLASPLSYGLVNLKPIRPGHVLVASRRPVARFNQLTSDEVTDLFLQGQRVSRVIERVYKAEGLTLCVQDGEHAGQSVPHVHLHVIPRHPGDFANNDDIYAVMERKEELQRIHRIDNEQRMPRTAEEMAEEALRLREEIGIKTWDSGYI